MNIVHAKQLITLAGPARARRGAELRELGVIEDGAVSMKDGMISWVGPTDALRERSSADFDASGCVVLPGFVDSHTHSVFETVRIDEFEWRGAGASYMEILARGGGIHSTVESVRNSHELHIRGEHAFLSYGTTTIEAKSGYGLNLKDEIRMLEAMRHARVLDIVPTYLGAHAIPKEFERERAAYVMQLLSDLEEISRRQLAEFCDVFVEPGAFSPDEARVILQRARQLGMGLRVHAEEFQHSGGVALAVELGAASADHLGAATENDVELLARSNVVATLLPATLFMLGEPRYAPARTLIAAGAAVGLASDYNPGTTPGMNMQFVMTLACTQMRMTPAEALSASTINSAAAIGRERMIGSIERGKQADIAVFSVPDYREIAFTAAINFCTATFKRGQLVYESNRRMHS